MLGYLADTSKGNVIYFNGWRGLGASAVLKLVARRFQSSSTKVTADPNPRLKFDKIIHVDCSVWKSRRALKKAIAVELELPCSVMAIFGQRDEEDDLNAVDEASRAEIADVASEIYKKVQGSRILVILHNGSSDYVDLNSCGIPVYGYLRNKVLWTWRGRFRLRIQLEEKIREKMTEQSDVILGAAHADWGSSSYDKWWDLVREEAEEVAQYTGIPEPDMKRQMVEDCILYRWALRDVDSIDWGTHASNYWVCDGIIQPGGGGTDRSAWEIGDALHRKMRLDWEFWEIISGAIRYYQWRPNDRWISATPQYLQQHDHVQQSSSGLPPEATSFFLAVDEAAEPSVLSAHMFHFQHPDSMLRVIQLSRCTFSFASPPFLSCRNLRFLLLDHCKDGHSASADGGVIESNHNGSWRVCFQKIWVLDLRYTDWYWLLSEEMINLMAELRELNVKGVKHWSLSQLHDGGTRSTTWLLNLVKLRVTTEAAEPTDDITQAPSVVEFPNLSSAIGLKEVILNGCVGMEQVSHDALPPSLESFIFSVDTSTKEKGVGEGGGTKDASRSAKVHSISFQRCAQLKISLLRGFLGRLEELDMSGTAVKTLDLSEMQAPQLERLFLLGCEKLRAILWPPEGKRPKFLEQLRIDTTRSLSADAARRSSVPNNKWHVSVRDARLLRSLVLAENFLVPWSEKEEATPEDLRIFVIKEEQPKPIIMQPQDIKKTIGIEISSPTSFVSVGGSKAQGISRRSSSSNNTTNNISNATSGFGFSEKHVLLSRQQPDNLYAHVVIFKDHLQPAAANDGHAPEIPSYYSDFLCYMHIQDEMKTELQRGSEGTTIALPGFVCDNAEILHMHDSLSITSITAPAVGSTWYILMLCRIERCPELQGSVFTAPQPLKARYIWNWNTAFQPEARSFEDLESLYLNQCPRLIHVLPLSTSIIPTFRSLETLEIVWCGDLRKVFRLDPERQEKLSAIEFPWLRRIHLHELPMLQHICGRRMSAPRLKTVKIRGCWSLRRLPAVRKEGASPRPTVDCEKEWWNSLEWDGEQEGHHPSLYEPRHSAYYKKRLPRGSPLR